MKSKICQIHRPRLLIITFTAATALAFGQTSARAATELSAADKTFFQKAGEGGLAEVELGKLAEKKGVSAEVKDMGEKMVADHSKANEELEKLAQTKGVALSKELSAAHKSSMNSMEKLEGEKFDHQYHTAMVKDHKEDIALFEKAAKSSDADIKGFAERTLPTLKEHLDMFEKMGDSAGKAAKKK